MLQPPPLLLLTLLLLPLLLLGRTSLAGWLSAHPAGTNEGEALPWVTCINACQWTNSLVLQT
jgi:hypothetical protein